MNYWKKVLLLYIGKSWSTSAVREIRVIDIVPCTINFIHLNLYQPLLWFFQKYITSYLRPIASRIDCVTNNIEKHLEEIIASLSWTLCCQLHWFFFKQVERHQSWRQWNYNFIWRIGLICICPLDGMISVASEGFFVVFKIHILHLQ